MLHPQCRVHQRLDSTPETLIKTTEERLQRDQLVSTVQTDSNSMQIQLGRQMLTSSCKVIDNSKTLLVLLPWKAPARMFCNGGDYKLACKISNFLSSVWLHRRDAGAAGQVVRPPSRAHSFSQAASRGPIEPPRRASCDGVNDTLIALMAPQQQPHATPVAPSVPTGAALNQSNLWMYVRVGIFHCTAYMGLALCFYLLPNEACMARMRQTEC